MHIISNIYFNFILNICFGVFTVLGVYYTLRRKYPKSLIYVETEIINLNSSVLKNYNNIKIIYDDSEIKNDIYLIKGFILNNGKLDITKNELENNLKADLETGKWLNCTILSTSKNLNARCLIKENSLFIESDLIKINEYILFEALAETTSRNINFTHRIANLGKVKNINFEKIEKKLFKSIIWNIILLFLIYLFSSTAINDYKTSYLFNFQYQQSIERKFHISLKANTKIDTTISFIEPFESIFYTLGTNSFDTLADYIHNNYNVLNLMINKPDTLIKVKTVHYGEIKVNIDKSVITELKILFAIVIILLTMIIFAIINLYRNVKYLSIKKKIMI